MSIEKHSLKSLAIVLFIMLLIYGEMTGTLVFLDEMLTLLAWGYVLILLCMSKLMKDDGKIILGLILIIFIGVLSNLVYKNVDNIMPIFRDMVSLTKLPIIYLLFCNIVKGKLKSEVIKIFLPIAKVYSICAFICAVLSLFIDLGMAGDKRFGIPSFHFVFPMQHQFTGVTIFVLCILLISMRKKHKKYIIMNCFSIFMTTKGPSIIFCIVFLYFIYNFKKNNKIKSWQIITIGIIVLILGSYQIETYLMNPHAPRTLFIKHSIEIANDNFPLGSGFASFGSPMAAENYSKLYYQFGFNKLFGLSETDGSFLYDVGLASILGQFGWIGFCIYFWILYMILILSTRNLKNIKRAFVYAVLIQLLIHSVGAAILNSSAAIISIIGVGIMSENSLTHKTKEPKRGVYFNGKN